MRRAAGDADEHDDILAMLERRPDTASPEGQERDGPPMDDRKLRDELVTFLSDGPTATSLAWAFERLLRHPDKLERLRAEVLAGDSEEYVDAVVKETLRLCPAVPVVMRRLTQPMQLNGYTIPPDTIVAPCVYLTHRRADIYPRPRAFEPERFLGEGAGTYTWIPVRRGCAPLRRRGVRAAGDEAGDPDRPHRGRSAPRRLPLGGSRQEPVSFAPDGGATVIATRRTRAPLELPTAA